MPLLGPISHRSLKPLVLTARDGNPGRHPESLDLQAKILR